MAKTLMDDYDLLTALGLPDTSDPLAYFRELLTALPTMTNKQVRDWTPAAWVKRHRAVVALTAVAS